ncbi:RRM domain-containing protein [Trichostrongylus colubriformis]|uniref:RRM domain-containing protein n=1 Tax=Trichostrongylus colubriformis TaxID=6319 RepID=A0AAN8F736_TRICO
MTDTAASDGEKKTLKREKEGMDDSTVNNGSGSMDVESSENGIPRSEFVVVSDNSGDPMELPTASDNSLFMTTLQSSYPGATGLKYKNPKTGALRAVAVDASGLKLLPPLDGWEDKVFTVITSSARTDRGSDVSVKRRKIGTSDGESDDDDEGRVGRKRAADARDSVNEPAGPRRPVDLIVLGVNYKTTDEAFKKYFESFGTVSFAEIKRTVEGSSKGFGFVQMSTLEEQDKVLATACHMLDGRRCEVRIPDQKHDGLGFPPSASRSMQPSKTLVNKIFVGRLLDKISESTLREFFEKEAKQVVESASVTDVFIPRPFRGFAFVTFTHAEVAEKMVKSNNFVIDGMSVVVTLAVPREESHERGPSGPPGYFNDFGYPPYGYGKGGGYGGSPGGPVPYHGREMFGYSPPGVYGRPPYEGWATPPSGMQGTPRSARGHGGPQPWNRYAKDAPPAAYPGRTPQQGPSVVQPRPYMHPREGMAVQTASNQIASGLDALNLNQKNPELVSAAWNAFFNTLSHGGASPQPHKQW